MNQFIAPINCDLTHHRNHFEPSVRAALGILDRVEEGQNVPDADIELALQVTGDSDPCARQGPTDRSEPGQHRECPTAPREQHPRAFGGAQIVFRELRDSRKFGVGVRP